MLRRLQQSLGGTLTHECFEKLQTLSFSARGLTCKASLEPASHGTQGCTERKEPSKPVLASPSTSLVSKAVNGLQVEQHRSMSFAYARKPEGKKFVYQEHAAKFGFGMLTDYLIKMVPKFIDMAVVSPGMSSPIHQEPTIYTKPEHLVPLCYFLRDHVNIQMKCLVDVTAVDFPERAARFEVVYHLLSPKWNNRIRIKVPVDEVTPVPTVVPVWNSANWFERETWDMYGVFFTGHPDLRRILTDYGFQGYPLRKDFPLSGYTEVRYDYSKKRVISEPVELTQEFRYFDFSSPWETLSR